MALKNNVYCFVISLLILAFSGCKMTRDIDEKYLIISDVTILGNEKDHTRQILEIKGDYAESAWGIKNIKSETIDDAIVLTGTLIWGGPGMFEYKVDIPSHVDVVRFYTKVVWKRQNGIK